MRKKWFQMIIGATLSVVLTACGNSGVSSSSTVSESNNSQDMYREEIGFDSMSQFENDSTEVTGDKLVYTGSITVETLKYQETVDAVRTKIKEYKGIIENEEEFDTNYSWYTYGNESSGTHHLTLTVRIPTEQFYDFMSAMEGTGGKVRNRSSNVENISKRYNDNETEIAALELQEKRLLEMMEQATTIEDMIAVESRLTEVQTQLNRYKSDKASMDMMVDYSTIDVSIDEVKEYRTNQETSFFDRLRNVFGSSWRGFVNSMEDLLFLLIRLLPYLIIIVPLAYVLKKFFPKRKKRKGEKEEKPVTEDKEEKKIL